MSAEWFVAKMSYRHTADTLLTHCKHTATHCKHTATHCNTLLHTAAHCSTLQRIANTLQTHCNTLQHTATHRNTPQHTATQVTEHFRQDVLLADQNLMSAEWFVAGQARNFPGVAFPAKLYWPSRPDGWNMREMVHSFLMKYRAFLMEYTALLMEYRALLMEYRALLMEYWGLA